VLYRDGHYYKKDQRDKVILPIACSGNKSTKATGKPQKTSVMDLERSAMGKPNLSISNLDGANNGTVDNSLDKPNFIVSHQGGAGKGTAKEEKERVQLLEKQLKIEQEKVEKLARGFEEERSKIMREHEVEKERARLKVEKLMQEKRELEEKGKEKEQEEMDEDITDVFELGEDLVQPGPYYNVRAARELSMEDEVVLGDWRGGRKKEAGFNIAGERRLEKVVWRHRLDVGQNITLSFNPASMTCSGCKKRGVHSVVGREDGKPVVLVASDQNFPPVLFSEDEGPCIGIMRMEFGTVKELGFAIGDMLHGISLPAGSITLVGSTSDLGKQGIVGYTDELARTLRIVKDKQSKRIQVVALPPVLLGGINSFMLLRLVVEAEHWAERMEGGAGVLLMRTRSEVVRMIGKHGKGTVTNPEERIDLLLKKVDGYERVRVRSAVWENMPERMLQLTVEGEH
jgi:hypothetical protein